MELYSMPMFNKFLVNDIEIIGMVSREFRF